MLRSTGLLAVWAGRVAAAEARASVARRAVLFSSSDGAPTSTSPSSAASTSRSARWREKKKKRNSNPDAADAAGLATLPAASGGGGGKSSSFSVATAAPPDDASAPLPGSGGPSSPDPEPIALLLRKLGLSKTLTRRSLSDRAGLLDLTTAGLRSLRSHLAITLTKKAETSFDGTEFLQGATGAFHAVHAAVAAQDWGALEEMTTPAIADAARRLTAAAAAEGLAVSLEVEPGVTAEIDNMSLLAPGRVESVAAGTRRLEDAGEEEVEVDDEEDETKKAPRRSSDEKGASSTSLESLFPELVGRHQGMHVRFSGGTVTLRLFAGRGAAATAAAAGLAAPPEEESTTVLEVVDRRARTWVFERGPFPPGLPVRDAQLAWRVLEIVP